MTRIAIAIALASAVWAQESDSVIRITTSLVQIDAIVTDKDGKAQITVTLPENLTTWKADVRAVTADSKVGQTTQELLSTKPLFIEMQTPRFFINGDQATVGATIHNNTDKSMSVNVSLDAKGVDLLSPPSSGNSGPRAAACAWPDRCRGDAGSRAGSGRRRT